MPKSNITTGHLAATITILIWGTTFIATKLLLQFFSPLEILIFRFAIGYLALLIICPKPVKMPLRHELLLLAAGFIGVTFYFLLENVALTLTSASNVGVIITLAPFFTALLSMVFLKSERPHARFYLGFVVAITGVALISFSGQALSLNPLGDLLTVFAALAWAAYSILLRRIGSFGYSNLVCTRRIFFYGLVTMVPAFAFFDFNPDLAGFTNPVCLFNLFYLGLGASAVGYLLWNFATHTLGAVRVSVYLYAQPAVTVAMAALLLGEPLTPLMLLGTALTLVGLVVSEYRRKGKGQPPAFNTTKAD